MRYGNSRDYTGSALLLVFQTLLCIAASAGHRSAIAPLLHHSRSLSACFLDQLRIVRIAPKAKHSVGVYTGTWNVKEHRACTSVERVKLSGFNGVGGRPARHGPR